MPKALHTDRPVDVGVMHGLMVHGAKRDYAVMAAGQSATVDRCGNVVDRRGCAADKATL